MPRVRLLTAFGRTQGIGEWARAYGLNPTTIDMRIKAGWTVEEAIRTPPHQTPPGQRRSHRHRAALAPADRALISQCRDERQRLADEIATAQREHEQLAAHLARLRRDYDELSPAKLAEKFGTTPGVVRNC